MKRKSDDHAVVESKEALELSKLHLECEKIHRELSEYTKPWWKKTSYLAIVIPLILGAGGLIQGYRSGYFDLQRQRLDLEAERQKIREERIEARLKELTDQEKEVEQRTKEVLTRRSDLDAKEKLLVHEQKGLEEKLKQAREEYTRRLAQAEAKYQADAGKLKETNQLEMVSTYIKDIEEESLASVDSTYATELVRLLRIKDEFKSKRLELVHKAAVDTQSRPGLQSVFLFILFRGSREEKWRNNLLTVIEQTLAKPIKKMDRFGPEDPTRVLAGIAHNQWQDNEREEIAVYTARLLDKVSSDLVPDVVWTYFNLSMAGKDLTPFRKNHPGEYLSATRKARDAYLKSTESSDVMDHLRASNGLKALSPQLFLVAASQVLLSKHATEDQAFAARILQETTYIASGPVILDNNNYPHSLDPENWKSWCQRNDRYVRLWLEKDLSTFQSNVNVLDEASSAWLRPSPYKLAR